MGEKEEKTAAATPAVGVGGDYYSPPPPYHQYGTFQGVAYYTQPSEPATAAGYPQPAPPPPGPVPPSAGPYHYTHGYNAVPGHAVAEGRPFREPRLPCCGIGIGWFLFVAGFFFAGFPWYIGALIYLCVGVDYREKPGLVACLVASILVLIAIVLGASQGAHFRHHHYHHLHW